MLVRRREKKRVINCDVVPGKACVKQHRLVVMDIRCRKKKVGKEKEQKDKGLESERTKSERI